MDKIDIANWNNHFSQAEQTLAESGGYTDFCLRFSEPKLAEGTIRHLRVRSMNLIEVKVSAEHPIILLDAAAKEGAESVFILGGAVTSQFTTLKQPINFGGKQHSIQYSANFQGEHTLHTGQFHALSIDYDLSYLSSILQSSESSSIAAIGEGIERKKHFLTNPHALSWGPRMTEVLHHIHDCPFSGMMRFLFLESKMMELLVLQLEQLQQLLNGTAKAYWRKDDKEKIHAVKDYLDQHYLEPLTLNELVIRFMLNEFKLKKGFRDFFGTSVFGYIHVLRMQHARELLLQREMTVTEVAWQVGYEHVSSFSAAFKKQFGYSPAAFSKTKLN